MLLSNNSYDNHGIHDNIVLPDITILKISLRYRLSWHFDIMINDNIVILPNSTTEIWNIALEWLLRVMWNRFIKIAYKLSQISRSQRLFLKEFSH